MPPKRLHRELDKDTTNTLQPSSSGFQTQHQQRHASKDYKGASEMRTRHKKGTTSTSKTSEASTSLGKGTTVSDEQNLKQIAELLKQERQEEKQQKLPSRLRKKLFTAQPFVKSRTLQSSKTSSVETTNSTSSEHDPSSSAEDSISKTVSSHYDGRKDLGIEKRKESFTLKIRNFNNWVKSVLIQLYVKPGDQVLDLSCGKGGDLLKFTKANIRSYIGADIAHNSVKDASRRYNDGKLPFSAKFIHADCCLKTLSNGMSPTDWFDVVSCQFALHYSFENEERARQYLFNATERLKEGGVFILTIPDSYVLVKKLKELGGGKDLRKFGNEFYSIQFDQYPPFSITSPFGIRYVFTLKDAVDECPEFLVHPRHFVKLARQFKLNLVEELNFHEFYEKYTKDATFKDLLFKVFRSRDVFLSSEEWDTIYLYRAFVFKKEGEKKSEYNPQSGTKPVGHTYLSEKDIIIL